MNTDFRALCAELMLGITSDVVLVEDPVRFEALFARARAKLAEPEAVGPTDKEILGLAAEAFHYRQIPANGVNIFVNAEEILSFARALHRLQANTTSTLPPSNETTP
jgi:hypothetical protein